MAKGNQDGQQMLQQQKQEEIRTAKTETLEPVQEQGTLSRSMTYSMPSGLQLEDKEEAAEKVRRAFAEKIKEQDAFLQEKRDLRSQYAYIQNLKQENSGDQQENAAYLEAEQQRMLPVMESRLKEMEQQELDWEAEMQEYVALGPEYERDYLMAQLEWAKQDQQLSEEKAGEMKEQIGQLYQDRIQAEQEKKEAELRKKAEEKQREAEEKQKEEARIQQLEYERKESVEWLSEHGDMGEQQELTGPEQLEFLYHVARLSELLPLLSSEETREKDPLQEQAENLLQEKKPLAVRLVRGTLGKEQAMQFPLLESVETFRKAIQSESMEERAAAWYQLRLFETGLGKENAGKTKIAVFRSYVEACMQELEQDEEKAKEFLIAAWNRMGESVSEFQKTNQFLSSTMAESVPQEKRERIAALAASLSMEGTEFARETIMDKRDLARLEGLFPDTDFLKDKKEQVQTEQEQLHSLSEQSLEQWNTEIDPELFSRIAEKWKIHPQEGLRDASVMQKQEYLNHLGQYRQARKNLAELGNRKKLKTLNGYLAEFDRYTKEEDILYSKVRERLFERINGEVQKLLGQNNPNEELEPEMKEALQECLLEAWKYTEAVHQYGETMSLIQTVLEEEEAAQLMIPYHGDMVRDARIQAALDAMKEEKTIFSSSEFKRIADRLKAYQSALIREGSDSSAAAAALQNVLDAADSYLIEKLTGKLKDKETGEPVEEVARISRMIFSGQFSLQDETAKSTGLTEEGFRRLKFVFQIRQIIKKTGPENKNGAEGENAQATENARRQILLKESTPLMRERYGLFQGLYGLEQLSYQAEQEVSMFSPRELKQVQETLKRYLDFGKRSSVDSLAAYRGSGLRPDGQVEHSAQYTDLVNAISGYEKKYPAESEAEETSQQKLVGAIRKAMEETEQNLGSYILEMQALMLESPEKTREILRNRAKKAAEAKKAEEEKKAAEAKKVAEEKKASGGDNAEDHAPEAGA